MNRDNFKVGDRVLCLLKWGTILQAWDGDEDYFLVHLDEGALQCFPFWEMHHEKDVTVME